MWSDLTCSSKHEKFQASETCNRSCSLFNVLHFLFLAFMARQSSLNFISKTPVFNVSINREEVIVIWHHRRKIDPAEIVTRRSIDFFITIVTIVPNRMFQNCQLYRQTFADNLFSVGGHEMSKETFAICEPDVTHLCRSRFFPLANIELSSHIDDYFSGSQTMLNNVGQCVNFSYQSTSANSSNSRWTPTWRMNDHFFRVQSVTCDLNSRMIPSTCSCSWQKLASLIVTTAQSQKKSGENRCHVDVEIAYSTIRLLCVFEFVCLAIQASNCLTDINWCTLLAAAFRVVSDWLHSLSVDFCSDTIFDIFIFLIVFLLANQKLLQQVVYIGKHHGNDFWFLFSKPEQDRIILLKGNLHCLHVFFDRSHNPRPSSFVPKAHVKPIRSTNNTFLWDAFTWDTIQQDSINFLSLEITVRDVAPVNPRRLSK